MPSTRLRYRDFRVVLVKKSLGLIGVSILASCGPAQPPAPPTAQQVQEATLFSYVADVCTQRGWVTNSAAVANLLTLTQSVTSRAPAQAQQARSAIMTQTPPNKVQPHHCRTMEMRALQFYQAQAQARQQAQYDALIQQQRDAALAAQSQNIQQNMRNITGSFPKTTYCHHYQWGNMTSCNSF